MANYGPDDVLVLVSGYNLGIDLFEAPITTEAILEETNTFGDAWVERSPVGTKAGTLTVRGFFDDTNDRSNEALVTGLTTQDRVVVATLEGNTQGQTALAMKSTQQNVVREASRGELHKLSADFRSQGIVDQDAFIVQTHVADSGAGVMSDGSLDNGAASSDGGRVYIQCSAISLGSYTNMQIKLQESSDNGSSDTWADVAGTTSTAITAAPTSEVLTIAAGTTIERYTRAFLVLNGSGSSESITALVALARD